VLIKEATETLAKGIAFFLFIYVPCLLLLCDACLAYT